MQDGTNNPQTPQPPRYQDDPRYRIPPEPRRRDLPYKQPWLAGILSGLFPGLGQIYAGYLMHGITIALIFVVIITALSSGDMRGIEPLLGMSIAFVYLYGIIDAARRSQAINRVLDGHGSAEVPEDIALPSRQGSMTGGTVLVVLGLIILGHTRFDLDLSWLEDWWPLALVALGGWLIYKARQEKSANDEKIGTYDQGGGGPRTL
jgi:TM2 domain-containing membrane protein YozV